MKNKTFFLRSGEQVLNSQGTINHFSYSIGATQQDKEQDKAGTQDGVVLTFGNNTAILQPSKARETKPAGTIEQLFRRMTKINQMAEH